MFYVPIRFLTVKGLNEKMIFHPIFFSQTNIFYPHYQNVEKFNFFHQSQAPKRGIVLYETEQMKGIHMKMRVIFQAYLDICL